MCLQGGNWSNPFVSFECLFAFVAVAAAYTHKASQMAFADASGPALLEASRLYRTASGFLDFAVNNVVPTLRNRGSAKYPSEVQTPVLQALSAVCMAQVCLALFVTPLQPADLCGTTGHSCCRPSIVLS